MVENLRVLDKFSTSDHQMIECDVIAKTLVKDMVKVRYCYDCADYEKIKTTLQEISWLELFANKKVEDMWQIFIGKLQAIIMFYRISSNRSPRPLLVQLRQTPGLYSRARPVFKAGFY